jgi:hypothetical protein
MQSENAPVQGDRDKLALAISNVVANAIAHAPPGSALELAVERPRPGLVRWSLRDHGAGVPDYAMPRLGERFFSTGARRAAAAWAWPSSARCCGCTAGNCASKRQSQGCAWSSCCRADSHRFGPPLNPSMVGVYFSRPFAVVGRRLAFYGRIGKAGPGRPVPLDLGVQFTSFAALTAFRARRVRGSSRPCGPTPLRCSPPPTRGTGHPGPALNQHRWRADRWRATYGGKRGGRYPPRVSRSRREAEEPGGTRAARLDIKTPGECLSESELSERSELPRGRPVLSIGAKSAQSADRRSPNPWRVPPVARSAASANSAITDRPQRAASQYSSHRRLIAPLNQTPTSPSLHKPHRRFTPALQTARQRNNPGAIEPCDIPSWPRHWP